MPPEDQRLVRHYAELSRPSDDLPYSVEFAELVNRLRAAGEARTEHEILRRLFQLRKAARLPRVGRGSSSVVDAPPADVELAENLLRRHLGATGSRDQLPYSEGFDEIWTEYNGSAARPLDKHQLWRLIARVSK